MEGKFELDTPDAPDALATDAPARDSTNIRFPGNGVARFAGDMEKLKELAKGLDGEETLKSAFRGSSGRSYPHLNRQWADIVLAGYDWKWPDRIPDDPRKRVRVMRRLMTTYACRNAIADVAHDRLPFDLGLLVASYLRLLPEYAPYAAVLEPYRACKRCAMYAGACYHHDDTYLCEGCNRGLDCVMKKPCVRRIA